MEAAVAAIGVVTVFSVIAIVLQGQRIGELEAGLKVALEVSTKTSKNLTTLAEAVRALNRRM